MSPLLAGLIQSMKLSTSTLATAEIGIVEEVGACQLNSARIDELAMLGSMQQSDVVLVVPFAGDGGAGAADVEMAAAAVVVVDEQ